MKLFLLSSFFVSLNAFAQSVSTPGLVVTEDWLRGPFQNGKPGETGAIAPSPAAFNKLANRVSTLEKILQAHDGIQENMKAEYRASIQAEEAARQKQAQDLRDEFCKSIKDAQSNICEDTIFMDALQELITKSVKAELAKSKTDEKKDQGK